MEGAARKSRVVRFPSKIISTTEEYEYINFTLT